MVDVALVPERFEHAIGKTKHQHVLHGLFAEIMVDTEDLVLLQDMQHRLVQGPSRVEITPKRFLNDDPTPPTALLLTLLDQISLAQLLHDLAKECRWCREVEEIISPRPPFTVTLLQHFGDFRIPSRLLERR